MKYIPNISLKPLQLTFQRLVRSVCVVFLFAGCVHVAMAQSSGARNASSPAAKLERPQLLSVLEGPAVNWREGMAHAVFYRPVADGKNQLVRIHVGLAYHAGLMPGTYAELCLPAGEQATTLNDVYLDKAPLAKQNASFVAGESRFFRVWQAADGEMRWQEVSRQKALEEAGDARLSISLTRVPTAQSCRTTEYAAR